MFFIQIIMKIFKKYALLALVGLMVSSSSDDDGLDVLDIDVPSGFSLSAGTSTNFMNSAFAYDNPADWVKGSYDTRFNLGDRLYDHVRTSDNGQLSLIHI